MTKRELRKKIRGVLADFPETEIQRESLKIAERLFALPEYRGAETVFAYASMKREVQTDWILARSLDAGKRVFLPKVTGKARMIFTEIRSLNDLVYTEPFGIREPSFLSEEAVEAPPVPELVLVPGLAFDKAGNRLGHGGGYYDRVLSELKSKTLLLGLSLSCQLLPEVPAEPFDIPVDRVLYMDERASAQPGVPGMEKTTDLP